MSVETFTGQPAKDSQEATKQDNSEVEALTSEISQGLAINLGAIATPLGFQSNFHPEEWGPELSARIRAARDADRSGPIESDQ